jgi:Glycosyl hydrolase family 26
MGLRKDRGGLSLRRKVIVPIAIAACLLVLGGLGFALARDAGEESASQTPAVTASVPQGQTSTAPTAEPAEPGVVLGARVLGGTQPDHPDHGRTDAAERARIEALLGRKLGMERIYYAWWEDWPTTYAVRTAKAGRIPLISFNSDGYTWRQIADAEGDAWLRARYRKIKAHPALEGAILIFNTEPEGDQATKGTPSDYVAAFRHVVRVARAEHLRNRWANTLQAYTINSGRPVEAWWPGDRYVDYVGWDIYGARATTPSVSDCSAERWRSFREAVTKPYKFARDHGKPMIIPELGQREDPQHSERKASWIKAVRFNLKTRFPDIVAISWAHSDFGGICPYPSTWWIDSSPQSLAAFAAMAADPYFQGSARRPPTALEEGD